MEQVLEQKSGLYTSPFGRIDEFNRGSHFKFNLLEFSILDNPSCILQVCPPLKD